MDFTTLPLGHVTLQNLTVPGCLIGRTDDLMRIDLHIDGGMLVDYPGLPLDMGGAMVFPAFIDMHTHLDKGHIWGRAPNPDGTFQGALDTVAADRKARWTAEDVKARMDFALRCAYAHGTRAIRTHLDSSPPQADITWPVFRDIQRRWAGRIDLQAVCLVSCEQIDEDFERIADLVAEADGALGMVSYPVPDLRDRLLLFFEYALDRGLPVDFHVDETLDPSAQTLRLIAETALEIEFSNPIVAGHCCSLATQDEGRALFTLDLVAQAGISIVSLPMCNLYLQDRRGGRTPRHRGITLVHEMKARDINVSFASDNTRDPFYAYGDLDMLEVMREATRIGHLDHSSVDWVRSFLNNPAAACGFQAPSVVVGTPADLVICKARNWAELMARPQSDRIVLRNGVQIDRTLPDFAELDVLMEPVHELV